MKVIITKQHCEGGSILSRYMNRLDCPLFRAIKEQHPEFPLRSVGGLSIMNKSDQRYKIISNWDCNKVRKLRDGELESFEVIISDEPGDFFI